MWVGAVRRSDDVVRHHPGDVQVVRPRHGGEVLRAEEPLLLAGDGHEHDRGVELMRRHDPRHLEDA